MQKAHDELFRQGVALWRKGEKGPALDALTQASVLAPQEATYPANLSAAYVELGEWSKAEAASRQALALAPQRAESWHGLGNALAGQQRWEEAAAAYEQAAILKPELPNCDQTAAQAWAKAGQPQRALQRYVRAAAGLQGRDDPELLSALAATLTQLNQLDQPVELYRRVAGMLPQNGPAQNNLGMSYQMLGRYEEAIACYRRALAIEPQQHATWSNLIVSLNYSPRHGPSDVLAAATEFDRVVARPLLDGRPHPNERSPSRPLRVGYVSPDLHRHAVAYFALPLIEGHTRQIEAVCYNSHRQVDEWTERFRAAAHEWVDCHGWSDEVLAQRIRFDRIDILVDLAGHTEGNRLLTFARKPAPVQVTWLGYVTTTGLSAIDWRMTYPSTDPAGADGHYVERLWRLGGGMWGYRPLPGMPEVAPAPLLRKGHLTFGYFNRFSKITPQAMECWCAILRQLPGARLLIGVPPGAPRQELGRFFAQRGVATDRIDVYDKVPHPTFWALHHEVDIALDPFPFNGGTTSYETLWLGVPLVTCTGGPTSFAPRFSSRMGQAVLEAVGLPELAATDEAGYVATAVALGRDPARVVRLRAELRPRMAASPLLDEALHVREIESAYRGMWLKWCGQSETGVGAQG